MTLLIKLKKCHLYTISTCKNQTEKPSPCQTTSEKYFS